MLGHRGVLQFTIKSTGELNKKINSLKKLNAEKQSPWNVNNEYVKKLFKMKKILNLIIMTTLYCHISFGQVVNKQDIYSRHHLSPQAWGFTVHGNQKASYFTGQTGTSITVYTYKDSDFTIPITLEYNMTGFKPNQREDMVGLGWHLNAGGAITRIVKGRPDEVQGVSGQGDYQPHGLFYGIKYIPNVTSKSLNSIFDLSAGVANSSWFWNIDNSEVAPDMFSFSMPGFSGRFYIQNNGEIKCIGNKPFKVDLDSFAIQYMTGIPEYDVEDSKIVITTDDGYKYFFGGNIKYLEVSYSLNYDNQVYNPVIESWYITKIIAPNGRTVQFQYRTFIEGIYQDEDPNDNEHYIYNVNCVGNYLSDNTTYYAGTPLSGSQGIGSYTSEDLIKPTKTAYLEKISIDETEIEFSYLEKGQLFYKSPQYLNDPFNQKNLRLDKIVVQNSDNETIKDFRFTQDYLGTTNPRMFLTSFGEYNQNNYEFDYYGETSFLPDPLTAGVDHWGFWNNRSTSTGSHTPELTFYTNGNVDITGLERNTDPLLCEKGMLETIKYPTQGTTTFHYEPHDYAKRLERKDDFSFRTKLYDIPGNCGGARVQKIVDNDGSLNTVEREFKYLNNYPEGGSTSSGILLDWPRYAFYWEQEIPGYALSQCLRMKSSSYNKNYSVYESYIQYSEVTEVSSPDGGYTNYQFTDFISNPDENDYDTMILDETVYPTITNVHLWNSYVGIKFNDKSFERGIPAKISVYKKEDGIYCLTHQRKITEFTSKGDFPNSYLVGVHQTGGIAQSYKIYYYPFLPKQISEVSYDNLGNVTVTTNNRYNDHGYLINKEVSRSDGSFLKTKYKYPLDYNIDLSWLQENPDEYTKALCGLKNNNNINSPVELITLTKEGANEKVIDGKLNLYKVENPSDPVDDWSINTSSIEQLEIHLPVDYNPNTFDSRISTNDPVFDYVFEYNSNYEPTIIFDDYDNYGNILQYHKENDIPISYIWGYNNNFPIAKVENSVSEVIYYTGFEDDPFISDWSGTSEFDNSITRTGDYSLKSMNIDASEDLNYSEIFYPTITTAQKFRYSVWAYSAGPSAEVFLFWDTNTTSSYTFCQGCVASESSSVLNEWVLIKGEVTVPAGVTKMFTRVDNNSQGNVWFDDLKFHPADAQMTTYTYDPLVGMTSTTDPNSQATHYEYDDFGRLERIVDSDGNLIQEIEYNYANQ